MIGEGSELSNEKKSFYSSLPKSLTTVTSFSKLLAMVLFVALPFVGFYLGYVYRQSLTVEKLVNEGGQTVLNSQPTIFPQNLMDTYVNKTCGFSLQYPHSLADIFQQKDENGISATGVEFEVILDLQVYKTALDPIAWWNKDGKSKYIGIYNVAFNDISIGKIGDVHGKEVLGQSKTPGGATISQSLLIIPGKGCLVIIQNNTQGNYSREFPGVENILDTFKFSE